MKLLTALDIAYWNNVVFTEDRNGLTEKYLETIVKH